MAYTKQDLLSLGVLGNFGPFVKLIAKNQVVNDFQNISSATRILGLLNYFVSSTAAVISANLPLTVNISSSTSSTVKYVKNLLMDVAITPATTSIRYLLSNLSSSVLISNSLSGIRSLISSLSINVTSSLLSRFAEVLYRRKDILSLRVLGHYGPFVKLPASISVINDFQNKVADTRFPSTLNYFFTIPVAKQVAAFQSTVTNSVSLAEVPIVRLIMAITSTNTIRSILTFAQNLRSTVMITSGLSSVRSLVQTLHKTVTSTVRLSALRHLVHSMSKSINATLHVTSFKRLYQTLAVDISTSVTLTSIRRFFTNLPLIISKSVTLTSQRFLVSNLIKTVSITQSISAVRYLLQNLVQTINISNTLASFVGYIIHLNMTVARSVQLHSALHFLNGWRDIGKAWVKFNGVVYHVKRIIKRTIHL